MVCPSARLIERSGLPSLVGLAVGVVASLRLPGRDLRGFVTAADRHGYGGGGNLVLQKSLILVQVALALVLLDGAGLMLRSLRHLAAVDPGFDASRLLAISVVFPSIQYPPGSEQIRSFLRQGFESLERIPGVEQVASGILPPIDGGALAGHVSGEGEVPGSGEGGGAFREGESTAVVVNQLFAEHFLAGENPLGKWLRVQSPLSPQPLQLEVVGGRGVRAAGRAEGRPGPRDLSAAFPGVDAVRDVLRPHRGRARGVAGRGAQGIAVG